MSKKGIRHLHFKAALRDIDKFRSGHLLELITSAGDEIVKSLYTRVSLIPREIHAQYERTLMIKYARFTFAISGYSVQGFREIKPLLFVYTEQIDELRQALQENFRESSRQ